MNFYDAVKHRRSVRNYKPAPIPADKLERIWEAVRWAPSACNIQPWRFLIVKSADMRSRLQKVLAQTWAFTAPMLIVGLGNRNTAWRRDNESIHPVDVAIASEHLMLAAAAEGLGTCWICAFDRRQVHQALGLTPEWEPVMLTPLGFPDDPSPRNGRKAAKEIVQEI